MIKIIIPITAYQNVPEIYKLVDDLTNLNSEVQKTAEGTNLIIDFPDNIKPENKLNADESVILSILDNDGQIEDYLFGIRQPSASASIDVPEDVPLRLFILGAVKNFSQWFANNADVWLNNVTDEIIYYNNPNPSGGPILKASEAEIIRQIDTVNYSFLTVAEVQTIVLDPNWTKL